MIFLDLFSAKSIENVTLIWRKAQLLSKIDKMTFIQYNLVW